MGSGQRDAASQLIRGAEILLGDMLLAVFSAPAYDLGFWTKLSATEKTAAMLILAGKSDQEIACLRGCSRQTITKQIDGLYEELGVHTRAQLAQRLIPLFPIK